MELNLKSLRWERENRKRPNNNIEIFPLHPLQVCVLPAHGTGHFGDLGLVVCVCVQWHGEGVTLGQKQIVISLGCFKISTVKVLHVKVELAHTVKGQCFSGNYTVCPLSLSQSVMSVIHCHFLKSLARLITSHQSQLFLMAKTLYSDHSLLFTMERQVEMGIVRHSSVGLSSTKEILV